MDASLRAFTVAVELAERRRDAARQTLASVQGARQAAQGQLDQLEGYAREIQQRWGAHEGRVLGPEVMSASYQFLGRLEHAAGLQVRVVASQDERVAGAQAALLQAELRLASLRKVLERRQAELQRSRARSEQKQTDERASLRLRATYDEEH
ncbi:flagellar export protein FliJ [Melaminivora alkalimesophila]|uniref:Flagellar FliJ protein n=1 Tax=Melaminivora alkalimesophila TaxID=1165852 RepID=A0A317R9V1_9BURK|nr:flagellar export protein FliJ [Melaminivora alkalimesophila]PWW44463.1 flagellar FliJ protein [Melaminivora alkalimesophila]